MKITFKTVTNDNGTRTVHAKGISINGNKFEGKATCSPNDPFIFCIGATIAETRARKNQIKKILSGEAKRQERLEILRKKSVREVKKLLEQLEELDEVELMYSK